MGISLDGYVLKNVITQEMTANEMKFALIVESALNSLIQPEYRQIMIESIMVFGHLLSLYPVDALKYSIIQLDLVIDQANELFLKNQIEVQGDAISCCAGRTRDIRKCKSFHNICQFFYDSAPSGEYGTMNFLAQALFAFIIKITSATSDTSCCVT
ncbi:hypothetical protein HZS_7825 [Henneguya salminicola]|nr:hypothetical protein HZS_7825 [Henneguya salminicola]